ncbi:cellulose binding domain-containing protein [Streptomyces canus]|uniref:cellulose binding domain-containing protein n=1 Tax=Streptomyces canus TaxID=58343 RepID=UPI00131A1527|nr:cellulose binding domain-containing protein [Streptomyces canus]
MKSNRLTAGRSHLSRRRSPAVCAAVFSAALLVATASGTASASPAAEGTASCTAVTQEVIYSNNGEYSAYVEVKNTGPVTINAWRAKGTLPEGQSVRTQWQAVLTVDGSEVTFDSTPYGYRPIQVGRSDYFVYTVRGYQDTRVPELTCEAQG